MRFKSRTTGGFRVFAVTGINTVSFAVQATAPASKGLLGFAVERIDPTEGERFFMPGYKVFPSVVPHPDPDTQVTTFEHPVQSFVWDDFTAKPDRRYDYVFHPLKGAPRNLDRTAPPVRIAVRTEKLFSDDEHDVFFNRGVASSQAYRRRFGNAKPDAMAPAERAAALRWLGRDLGTALLRFIARARKGDGLLCCFYELHHAPVLDALKKAIDEGVDVRVIFDAKVNATPAAKSFPRTANLAAIAAAKLPAETLVRRERNPGDIQHNKFMVLLKGARRRPAEVWTGSTNVSLGGITGQTNVGHWLRNEDVARRFAAYWELLRGDPGSDAADDRSTAAAKKKALRAAVEGLQAVPTRLADIPQGTTAVFSPRSGTDVLALYVALVDAAEDASCITLAFGVNELFKAQLRDNTRQSHITFLLLEKKDAPHANSTKPFVVINASNNVYKAWGAYLRDPVYQWAKETNTRMLGLNQHVVYVHSKFLLRDPLGDDPIVVTGSANFSEPSTTSNDENMLIIRGSKRAADIYFTEFNRLFNHYYFRSVTESLRDAGRQDDGASLFLAESDTWLRKYAPGKLRAKRVALYAGMRGFSRA